jgi:hypothetical protein
VERLLVVIADLRGQTQRNRARCKEYTIYEDEVTRAPKAEARMTWVANEESSGWFN